MWWEVEFKPFDDGFGHFRSMWNDVFFYYYYYYYFITMSIITLPLTCSRLQNILLCNYHDKSEENARELWRQEIPAKHWRRKYENDSNKSKFWQFDSLNLSKLDKKRVKEGSEKYAYRISFLFPTTASFSLTWDQAPFSFLFVNNILAGKPDRIRENWLHMRTAKIGPDLRLPFLLSCTSNFRFRTLFSL